MSTNPRRQQIEWRRSQVLELASGGYNQREIASKLQLDKSTVNRDFHFLKQQAKNNLQKHIHETVPEEYERCMIGMKRNLKQTLEIAESVSDPRVKLQARAIVNDCYKYIMDLTTNGVIVNDALRFSQSKVDNLNIIHKADESIESIEAEAEAEEEAETTINGVF